MSKEFSVEEISTLLWVKALNDFKDTDCPNDTLDDKINKFDVESADMQYADFADALEQWCKLGILKNDEVITITPAGEKVFKALSVVNGLSDMTITNMINNSIVFTKFVKEHIFEIANIILKVASL